MLVFRSIYIDCITFYSTYNSILQYSIYAPASYGCHRDTLPIAMNIFVAAVAVRGHRVHSIMDGGMHVCVYVCACVYTTYIKYNA